MARYDAAMTPPLVAGLLAFSLSPLAVAQTQPSSAGPRLSPPPSTLTMPPPGGAAGVGTGPAMGPPPGMGGAPGMPPEPPKLTRTDVERLIKLIPELAKEGGKMQGGTPMAMGGGMDPAQMQDLKRIETLLNQ